MIPLIDTVTGFAAIMLVLSLLVKSLTSLIKNHVDFYSRNLKHEVDGLALAVLGKTWDEAVNTLQTDPATQKDAIWFKGINWERLGDEFLSKQNMEWVLTKLGAPPSTLDHLEDRVQVHAANLSYAFNTRIKNLALLVGVGLCLGLNINSFSIWQSLYSDQQLRTTFATTYAKSALKSAEAANQPAPKAPTTPSGGGPGSASNTGSQRQEEEKLNENTQKFMDHLAGFQKDVSFGVGRVWDSATWNKQSKMDERKKAPSPWEFALLEFSGSLMTGILISIGAAYWHDLLRALSSLRAK